MVGVVVGMIDVVVVAVVVVEVVGVVILVLLDGEVQEKRRPSDIWIGGLSASVFSLGNFILSFGVLCGSGVYGGCSSCGGGVIFGWR